MFGTGIGRRGTKLSCSTMRGQAVKAIARRLQLRAATERAVDSARLVIDSFSDPVYQPVAELGRRYVSADRTEGTASRWEAMRRVTTELQPATAVDIGCNAGWFTLQLARLGIAALGVDGHPPYYRAAITAVRRSGLDNVGIMALDLTPATIGLVPTADCMIFLSVWHHVVRGSGLEAASALLQRLWERTRMVMFFETGESDEFASTDFGLPDMRPDARSWISDYLVRECQDAVVEHLGTHPSGPDSNATRSLFAVRRRSDSRATTPPPPSGS